jgi:hypothetical protein
MFFYLVNKSGEQDIKHECCDDKHYACQVALTLEQIAFLFADLGKGAVFQLDLLI